MSLERGSIYDLVNTGRVSLRCWLELTKEGYSLQPLTISCLMPYDLRVNGFCRRCPEEYINLFNKSHDLFKENFNFPAEDQVLWFFRTGLVKPLTDDQRTLRFPVDKYLES